MSNKNQLTNEQSEQLLTVLKTRFEENPERHKSLKWENIQAKLEANPGKLWSLNEMERTGGEPDVIAYDKKTDEYVYYDCSPESPKERRSLCYDREALESRKKHKPKNSAVDLSAEIGIDLLTDEEYFKLQELGDFDTKSSSWLNTPSDIRELGGAIFGDFRFGRTFIYHNGAESYYAARGFRGKLKV